MLNFTPSPKPRETGWIEVICGCMFSGKTEELIRRLRRAKIAKLNVMIFKPSIDSRFSSEKIVSHSEQELSSIQINDADELLELAKDAQVVGIDEAQFFKINLVDVVNKLANEGKIVVIAGLDQDYTGKPFEPMPQLLATAEYITKTLAICVECGNPADKTQRKTTSNKLVLVGASDSYEARCRKCHYIPNNK